MLKSGKITQDYTRLHNKDPDLKLGENSNDLSIRIMEGPISKDNGEITRNWNCEVVLSRACCLRAFLYYVLFYLFPVVLIGLLLYFYYKSITEEAAALAEEAILKKLNNTSK